MREEISPSKNIKIYALGFACLLTPILISFCIQIGWGEFVAVGSYIISSQSFIQSIISFLVSSLGPGYCFLLAITVILIWLAGGVFSLVFSILSLFIKKWSYRTRIIYVCLLAGYILSYAWIKYNPPEQQIKFALHSKISRGFTRAQVIKVLSSQNIYFGDNSDKTMLEAYIPNDWQNEHTYLIDFYFTDNKLSRFTVATQQELYDRHK